MGFTRYHIAGVSDIFIPDGGGSLTGLPTNIRSIEIVPGAGAGAVACVGALVGDVVTGVLICDLNNTNVIPSGIGGNAVQFPQVNVRNATKGGLWGPFPAFESTITVVNEIQQFAFDLSRWSALLVQLYTPHS